MLVSKILSIVSTPAVNTIVIVVSTVLILNQSISAIIINMIVRFSHYIKSYHRIITIMVGESIYELQFLQILGCIYFIQAKFLPEISYIFEFISKVFM